MALKLSAPVGDKTRITKPVPKTGESKLKPVRNAPADVELVRLMLKGNGYSVDISTKCDAGLIKAIKDFQKKTLGFKKPDSIADPSMRTWNAGLPKLAAQHAADTKAERVEGVENGKTKLITVAEFEAGQEELRRKLLAKASMMCGQAGSWIGFCNEVENTCQGNETFLNALMAFTVSVVNDKTDAPWTPILNARSEASFLKTKLVPAALEGAVKKDLIAKYGAKATEDFIKLHGNAVHGEIAKQISGKTFSKYAGEVLASSDSSQSASTMQKQANEAMRKDMELRKKIQKIIMAEAERKMPKTAAAH